MKLSDLYLLNINSQGINNTFFIYIFITGLIIALILIFIYIYKNKERIMTSIPSLKERQRLKEDFIRNKKKEENQGQN